MRTVRSAIVIGATAGITAYLLVLLAAVDANAQQATGVPGSPSATTTIDGKQLPPPDPKFGGVIKDNALQSKPWWAPRVVPPKGAPNVLLIMTDDAASACRARSAALSRRQRWTASPSPACATITSTPPRSARRRAPRSSPAVTITRRASAWSPSSPRASRATTASSPRTRPPSAASCWTTATPRRGSARTTTRPPSRPAQVGPFDQWPTGMGFEYFYGFVGGDANQWQPNLFRNTTADLSLRGQAGLESRHRHGRRRHRLPEPGQPD